VVRQPQLIVVAGPNGVGKSTYTRQAFASGFLLLDPDRHAMDNPGSSPLAGGRNVIDRIRRALQDRTDLVIETTLSGQYPMRVLRDAGARDYARTLIYVGIDDPAECVRRVRKRVAEGGHDVPHADILRRYARSLTALPMAVDLADRVLLIDNALHGAYRLIALSQPGETTVERAIPPWALAAVARLELR
jgi:predicted ABC-type ATPase